MAFVKTTWVDRVTAASAAQLNRIEQGIDDLYNAGIRKAAGAFRASQGATLVNVASGGAGAKLVWTQAEEVFDVSGWFDPVAGRFTPQLAGFYRVTGRCVTSQVLASGTDLEVRLLKNGTLDFNNRTISASAVAAVFAEVNGTVQLNGTTDYLELWAWHDFGSARTIGGHFYGEFIGTA